MLILALDLAKKTGWAFGPAGEIPQSGSWNLRSSSDPIEAEGPELIRRILALIGARRPDVIVVEDYMQPRAQHSQAVIIAQLMLHGGLNTWAGVSRINLHRVAAGTVRKHVCGKASAGDRDKTKAMVLHTVKLLGLVPRDSDDTDRSDAVCVWRWAEDVLADVRGRMSLVPA